MLTDSKIEGILDLSAGIKIERKIPALDNGTNILKYLNVVKKSIVVGQNQRCEI